MNDEPEAAPAPPQPETPAPVILESRVAQLEADLKELAGIGHKAYEDLVARIEKLEATGPGPAPPQHPSVTVVPTPVEPPSGADANGWSRRV